jgi:hypothetical protein
MWFRMLDSRLSSDGVGPAPAAACCELSEPDGVGGAQFAGRAAHVDFAVARYTPDGALDARFGNGGKVTIDVGGLEPFYFGQRNMDMALSGDRIDLAGIGDTGGNLYVAQLTARANWTHPLVSAAW